MRIIDQPAKIFNSRAAAESVCVGLDAGEFRIVEDPKGSGRCLIMMVDEETGADIGYF